MQSQQKKNGWLPLLLWGFPKVEYPTDGRFGGRVIGQVDHENAINIYWGKHKLDWNPPAVSRWVGGHTVCVNVKKLSHLSGYWISIYVWRPKMQQQIEMKCHFESPKQIQRKREKGKNLNLNLKWKTEIAWENFPISHSEVTSLGKSLMSSQPNKSRWLVFLSTLLWRG